LKSTNGVASTANHYPHLEDAVLTGSRITGRHRGLYPKSKFILARDDSKDMQAQAAAAFESLLAKVRSDPAVFYAQPNLKYHITTQYPTNDSLYTKGVLWGVASSGSPAPIGPISNQYGTEAEKLWQANQTGSRNVLIGIVDSGADADHPDLAANIDTQDARDFYRAAGDPNYNKDENGHGTHVAGIIGAVGNNGFGVSGVAWQVAMIPVKFIGPDGSGDTADAVQAFNYLVGLRQRGKNIVAINASFATSDPDPLLLAAIKSAARAGIVTVSAADNSGQDIGTNKVYPASFDTSSDNSDQSGTLPYNSNITVAALDLNGQKASFSNYGGTVELGAPGVGIVSTMIPNPDPSLISDKFGIVTESNGGTYASLDGTSMAAPYVTGAIVLLASAHLDSTGHTTLSAQDICTLIRNDAASTPTPSMSGSATTGGRLDIAKLIPGTTP
jgi:subtilisin family serine protease